MSETRRPSTGCDRPLSSKSIFPGVVVLALAALFLSLAGATPASAEPLTRTERIESEILDEERVVRVFLPASYDELSSGRYPVLYMVDGDYSFLYVSGLLEQMSSISEQIPEMIFVAIDDRGKTAYRRNMSPTLSDDDPENDGEGDAEAGVAMGGDASKFLRYLEEELIPHVESKYRVAGYRTLAGHSMGGLFTVAALLEKPDLFDAYIAISPSLWWQEQALEKEAERVLDARPDLEARLYLTVADERGMGVLGFADLLDRKAPAGLEWSFERLLDENHGSVGVPSLRKALRKEFDGYVLSAEQFYALDGADEVVGHFAALEERGTFLLPARSLANILNFYFRREMLDEIERMEAAISQHFPESLPIFRMAVASHHLAREEWQQAHDLYRRVATDEPNAYSAWAGAALALAELRRADEAATMIQKAIELAESNGARQWQINQLEADRRHIESKRGESRTD